MKPNVLVSIFVYTPLLSAVALSKLKIAVSFIAILIINISAASESLLTRSR